MTALMWTMRLIAALLMLQTLYFKFSAHPQSVKLFTKIGMEPWGRIAVGIVELIASAMILYYPMTWVGSILGIGLMLGAIYFHFTKIGIYFNGDPLLFIYAVIILVNCSGLVYLLRQKAFGDLLSLIP